MVVLVMGVAGAGKTLIGSMLANSLGWKFLDADDFHSPENLRKMSQGTPLTDADREPWLSALRLEIAKSANSGVNVVLACSALKEQYRQQLAGSAGLTIVFLKGEFDLIHARLAGRQAHFMRPEMLASQFADLEAPAEAITIDVSATPEDIVAKIRERLPALPALP